MAKLQDEMRDTALVKGKNNAELLRGRYSGKSDGRQGLESNRPRNSSETSERSPSQPASA